MHPMLRRLRKDSMGSSDHLLLERAAEAMALGGRAGLLIWLQHREQMVRHISELVALAMIWGELTDELLRLDSKAAAAEVNRLAAVEAAASERRAREAQQAAVERERERRAADPRDAIRTRLERVLAGPAAIRPQPPESPMTQPEKQQHWSTDPEHCGIRLGRKLDRLLAEVQALDVEEPPRPRLVWSRSHGEIEEPMTLSIPRSGDPPAPAAAGVGPGAGEAAVVDGGVTAANAPPLREGETSAWEWLVHPDGGGQPVDLEELIRLLDESPEMRSAALLRSIERFRDALTQLPTSAPVETPVTICAGDLVPLLRAVLSRLR